LVFSSITFLCYFLPVFFIVYYLVGNKYKNYVILLFSIFFYSWGAPKFIFVLLASTFFDFYLVQWMHQTNTSKKKKILLSLSILLNVGLLAYFKYANFFIDNVNAILIKTGITEVGWAEVLLPIGISFYTFQTLTYSIDVYRNTHKPLEKVSNYMLYIIMFPQLIAGPIVRFNQIAAQLTNRETTIEDRLLGFYRFAIGLSKKVLIANVLGEKADAIMGSTDILSLDSSTAWIGLLAYTFQIYFDFSGYSDMAIGIGRMLGFKFPENFNMPYISKSISEFWRRWHITLGAWMRDYLYIPLGGNRVNNKTRLYFNLWLVFLISGLWHGASWNFVLWGAFHGLFLIFDRLFLISFLNKIGKTFAILFTFFVVMMGWVIFKIEDIKMAGIYYKKLFAFDFTTLDWQSEKEFYFVLLLAFIFAFFTLIPKFGNAVYQQVFYKSYPVKLNLLMAFISILLFILCLSSLANTGFNPFIYFRF